MRNPRPVIRLSRSASAVGLLVASLAAHAQQASNPPADANKAQLDAVVVTGIRQSLESSLNLKRNARGLVDGIVAEDIGKFPDTNLAESMQRIAGVSIDRNSSGEGSKVTVRGVGPDFNLVLLNGRRVSTHGMSGGAVDLTLATADGMELDLGTGFDAFVRLFSNDIAPVRLARDLGMAAVNRIGPLRRAFMQEAGGATSITHQYGIG